MGYVYLARLIVGFIRCKGLHCIDSPLKTRTQEDHMGMLNSMGCHSLSQIAALSRKRRVVGLAQRGHESGGVRTERGGEPGQGATPAYGASLALQLTNGGDADPCQRPSCGPRWWPGKSPHPSG